MEQDVIEGIHTQDLRKTVKRWNQDGWRVVQVITFEGHWSVNLLIERSAKDWRPPTFRG